MLFFFFFKQKTEYEWRISDWSSDVCSSDLSAPVDIHSLMEMDADDYNSGYGRSTLHLPPPRSLTGTILKLGAVAGFLWLALATAALNRKSTRLNSSH